MAQASRNLAVLAGGRVLFRGTSTGLIEAANDRVWTVGTDSPKPDGGLTVVSTPHLKGSVRYRVVGEPAPGLGAVRAEPSLEDGYVWLMRENRMTAAT